jgi:hypothetical protein
MPRWKDPNRKMLQQILELVRLEKTAFAERFNGEVCKIIREARTRSAVKRYSPPKRKDVCDLIDGLIDALAPIVEQDAEETAVYVRIKLETDATDLELLLQRARAARADVVGDRAVFAKRGPRPGSDERPELDYFLLRFVLLVRRQGGAVSAPYKSEHVDTGAVGSLVEVAHLVARCFRTGFLPDNDYTLVDACLRALRAADSMTESAEDAAARRQYWRTVEPSKHGLWFHVVAEDALDYNVN